MMDEQRTISGVGATEEKRSSLLGLIGSTPLIRLTRVAGGLVDPDMEIFAKAEWKNPGGSVKDRPALSMILEGERSGALTKEKSIIDATSGNTGIALAMIGAALGYRVSIAIPDNATAERKQILHILGAEVVYTDPLEGTDGAQEVVKHIVKKNPDKYFYVDQYNNPANWQAHYRTTAVEILEQTRRRITHFVAGLGTTGTFVGTSRRLKEAKNDVKCISFQPDAPLHGLEGLKHLETARIPGIYDAKLADENLAVSSEEAYEMVHRLAKEEGILVGPSSGAALVACLKVAQTIQRGTIVTIFPDDGLKYLSHGLWNINNKPS